jgi:predicted outer membrane repeat protein
MMNRKILIGLVALLAVNSLLLADQPAYRPGVVLVRFANDPNTTAKSAILNSALGRGGSSIKREYTLVKGLTNVSLPTGVSVENAVASLKQSSSILRAEPDYIYHTSAIPNDTSFAQLWGMRNTGQFGGTPGADISATYAWDINTGSSNVIVAVTDTGVDYTHQDLAANMWKDPNGHFGYDFVNNDNDPMDDQGHGTHVSGTIGAVGNNAMGVTGVCWHVRIMAVKCFDANGMGYTSNEISAIEYSVANGAKVINASWGGYAYSQNLYDAIASARDAGVIFVAAAGNSSINNDSTTPAYPASYDLANIISVMATTDTDQQASFSNYGLTSVDIGAPGQNILSTVPGNTYDYYSGTSMASPHVAGTCALLLSIDPTLTYSQVKQILLNTVDKTLPGLCVSGGRLNLAAAAQEAAMDSTPPTPSTAGWLMPPVATGLHTIAMEALNEIDRSNVEYYFECVNDANINSGWEPNTLCVFKDPSESRIKHARTYGFRVKARDKSANHNETAWSDTMYATTAAVTDNLPPAPSPAQWATQPIFIRPGVLRMQIKGKGTDENGEKFKYLYYDILTPAITIDSGWQNSADGTMSGPTGLTLNHTYVFNCKVKDNLGNETGWSPDVYVTFSNATGPRTLHVPAEYLTIQGAIDAASPGDIVVVSPYPVPPYYYQGINIRGLEANINLRFRGKAITVQSTDPENPDVVAATIIDCNGVIDPTGPRRAFIFDQGEGADSIVAGFTIRNAYVKGHPGRNGDANLADINALSGRTAAGGAILCGPNPDPCTTLELSYTNWHTGTGSPTIRNCVFMNCIVEGGDGGLGADGNDGNDYRAADPCTIPPTTEANAMPGQSGGNGGWSGSGCGGAIYCSNGSNPVIKNCAIINCFALSGLPGNGGNGGNGGNDPNHGQQRGGNAGSGADVNYVAGGAICAFYGSNPTIIGCDINDCNAHVITTFSSAGLPGAGNPPGLPSYYYPNFGQAYGGGIFYAVGNAAVNISSTSFARNRAQEDTEGGIYKDGYGGGICLDVYGGAASTMADCNFTGNSADTHGGGIIYYGGGAWGALILQNCAMTDNTAVVDGGGLAGWFYNSDTFEAHNSEIGGNIAGAGNNAGYGGGFYLDSATATIDDCNFAHNQAQEGGAIAGANCQVDIHGSDITDNSAVAPSGLGGGFALWNTIGNVTDCTMKSNSAAENGGAVYSEGWVTQPLDFSNCLITDNTANFEGGGLSNSIGAWMQLNNCTVAYNSATNFVHSAGGGVSDAEYFAWVEISDSILWGNSAAYGSQIAVGSIFGSSPDPGGYYADVDVSNSDVEGGKGQVFIENPAYMAVWWMYGSFDADPLFANIDVNQPAYYLSQKAAGQLNDSPCVDAGDILASDLESDVDPTLSTRLTTRTDLVEDTGAVDLGYHYKAGLVGSAGKYPLSIAVYEYDPNEGGHGRLNAKTTPQNGTQFDINDPNTIQVNQGTVVNLTTFNIDPGYRVQSWSGTDNDGSTALTNTVTMNSGRNVIVTFEPNGLYYLTITLIGNGTITPPAGRTLRAPGEVVPLIAAPANPADTVIWTGTDNDNTDGKTNTVTMTGNKNVTVRFYTPRILHVGGSSDYPTIQAAINDANDRDIIILMPSSQPYFTQTGFTIIGRNLTITSSNPDDPAVVASTIIQQAVGDSGGVNPAFVFSEVGPLMRLWGITIRGFSGTGTSGLNGDPSRFYYDGRYGSTVPAMGIDCITNASPTIKNCVIDNCHSTGGNGGNGAAGNGGGTPPHPNGGNGGWPGGAWGGGLTCYDNSSPTLINCTFSNNSAIGGNGGDGGNGSGLPNIGSGGCGGGWFYGYDIPSPWEPGSYLGGLPKDWSGLGGAVYVATDCYPIFEGCTFTNNTSRGGQNGICGQTPLPNLRAEPSIRYNIDNLGGAVYLAEGSSADFDNCTFTTNIADTNRLPASFDGFLGYGGAIAADDYATPIIRNCSFSNNTGDVGGGVYSNLSYAEVNDCSFSGNTASHGGGLLFSDSVAYITGSTFSSNVGIISGSDGGAIGLLGTNAEVVDCNIVNNLVGGSGGGIYMSSKNVDGNEIEGDNYVLIKNCLITGNAADLDGGGISANWYSEPNIVNCTIFNNRVSGLGGGLFSSYGSYVNVLNCIIWDNQAGIGASGSQIAVRGGELPSTIRVRYSDVQDSNDPNAWANDINALDFVICFDTTGSMGGDIDAVRTAASQIVNAIAARFTSYRLGLVDFRDYPDGNHGSIGDWPYLDRVRFTTDVNQLIAGLQPMVAGGGADGPEAIYTALMHCIDANALAARLTADGYANYIDPNSPGLGNWRQGTKVMRVILLLTDAPPHDPEPYTNYVLNDIITAANGSNPIHIMPVVIRGDPAAEDALRPVAVGTGGTLIPATDSNAVPAAVLDAIGLFSQIATPIFIETGSAINWDSNTFWDPNSHNINADPLFIGGFFLSQIAAGQISDSPCVNTGSADVNSPDINLAGYTTRTDSVPDVCIVDMGYHYPLFTAHLHQYSLTIEVNGVGGRLFAIGRGDDAFTIMAPHIRQVNANTVVSLQALADAGYGVLSWTGTDNDASIDPNNTITMDSDKVVEVEFHQYTLTIEVMGANGLDPNGYLVATETGVNPFTINARQEPNSHGVAPGSVVSLQAFPDANFRVRLWTGTDNDASTARTNTVTMNNSDKTVVVGFEPNGLYYLTITKIGNGAISPIVGRYLHAPGDVVTLNATPTNPSDAIIWTGTDDDYSTARQNTVTMNGHKNVTVEFYTPRILYVGTDTGYPTIQFAIDAAQNRDIVMITPGTYNIYESSKDHPYLYISGKEIRLTSTNPEDANATQIIGGFVIDNATRRLIIEGLTIRDAIYWKDYEQGILTGAQDSSFQEFWATPQGSGVDGYGGGTCRGAGMQLNGAASPTVRNCLFINCVARGLHGATGAGGSGDDGWGGNGGPGGKAFGGGAYCGQNGSPLFENCSFTNCSAVAGDAGNGGNAAPATGGHGGAWGDVNGVWWDEWRTLYGNIHPLEEYWKYSGYGGAIYCDINSTAEFVNCAFTGNSVMGSSCGISGASVPSGWPTQHYKIESFGGAVYAASGSAPQFVECSFTDNEANMDGPSANRNDNVAPVNAYPNVSFGGAVAFEDGAAPVFEKCEFNGNRATIGGGAFAAWAYGTVTDCNFEDNFSYSGGGILYVGGTSEILSSRFTGNQSTVSAAQGGAITLLGADAEIRDCNIWANASAGSGGGIYISSQDVEGNTLPGGNSVLVKNCLITGNSAVQNGAGISATWYSDPNIVNCTIVGNISQGMGGGLYSAYNNYTQISNSIFWDNNAPQGPQIAIGTTANPAYVKVTYSDIEGGAADVCLAPLTILEWDVASSNPHYPTNINMDPLFIGGFFLSQIGAGQDANSPCVNAGSANVNSPDINLAGYTTRIDGVNDVGIVDMGYHYSAFTPLQYHLTIIAEDGLTSANITPSDGNYVWFSKVPLHVNVTPPNGYQIVWTGTDNDDINDGNNSVRMTGDKTVTVGLGNNTCNLTVISSSGGTVTPTSGTYPRGTAVTLTATPNVGYRIESWQGTDNDGLFTQTNTVTMNRNKTVSVTFSLPQTRTVPGDYTTIQEAIEAARSGDIVSVASGVYHGSTIVLDKEITLASTNPDDPCVVAATIIDSTGYQGGLALYFTAGATANTVVDGFTITSGTYRRVDAQNATATGQNGPDGGGIQGGTVYIDTGASPTLRNCVIRDTSITGGNAGSGGNADTATPAGRGGWGGWARGGGVYVAPFANPTLINCTVTNCSVTGGTGGNGGDSSGTFGAGYQDANYGGLWSNDFSFPWRQLINSNGQPYVGDYRFYSGYGGGVFCDANSEANFIDCSITNNIASGGMSGIGGSRPQGAFIPDPITAYRIPSYGGGVYCGANSDINFVGCVITGNIAPRPDATYHTDPYLGHGGGIAFEDTTTIRLQNCTISDNNSAVGGGMFWSGGEPEVLGCEIMRNTAYLGGGIYAMESAGQIRGCTLHNNFAGVSPNDVDVVAGQGGGIFGSSIDTVIADCFLTNNTSSTSGGGIHIYGPAYYDTIIRNCLLTGNQAGRDGGGISTNWGAVVSVENCTLYNNQATGTFGVSGNTGFGGGLYCSYEAQTNVRNSIVWDNNGLLGNEIAEATGFEHEQRCGDINVSYSDIRGGRAGVYISPGCPSNWGIGNINIDPCFVNAVSGDFHLEQITAGQMVNSPCVDAGGDLAVSLGMYKYSTSTLGTSDTGIVDLGYHYTIAEYCRKWDLYVDNLIDFRDFAVFASAWVGDLRNTGYGRDDLKEFTYCWLEQLAADMNAPIPNPMTWAMLPHPLPGNSVEMTASTAVDSSGQVYYQFEEVGGALSTWQTNTYYMVTNVSPTGSHCFMVRARDKYNNITAWSEPACVSNIGDVNAPTPAPVFVAVAAQNINRTDANTASGQFEWNPANYQFDWWHRVIVDVTGVTDNITPTTELEVRFICSDSAYSSDTVIPAMYRPILIGHPVAIGGRVPDGSGAASGSYRLTWNGANQIVYEVYVDATGGSYGRQLSWHVCVYDASGNSVCTGTHTIPQ